jgi:hypothetical protein
MNATLKSKWWIDAGLFAIFLTAFFLNLTGLALHQWIGIAAGAVAIYHLVTHWAWVKSVTARLFTQAPNRSQLYYVVDALLMGGLFTIIATGLVISTWLNLSLTTYAAWRFVHVAASIITLAVTVAKIAIHWRWIVSEANKIFTQPAQAPARTNLGQPALPGKMVTRREFGSLMAVVGLTSILALSRGVKSLQTSENDTSVASTTTTAASSSAVDLTSLFSTTQNTTTTTSAVASTPRCPNGCSFPGRCRRYTDSNGNGRCDLGESA